ncbi:T6 antigen [Mycobacteroides abscessus subsp. abscessus]|nr:T6 antigen [Mycobacteroides abscessus subsp. abscessus]
MFTHAHRNVAKGGLLTVLVALFAALAVLVSPLAHAASVGDAKNPAITITSDEGDHTYGAYQIFKGNANGEQLASIEWGTGVDSALLRKELAEKFTEVTGDENAAQLAAKLSKLDAVKLSKIVAKHVKGSPVTFTKTGEKAPFTYTADTVEQGYYVIVDTNTKEASAVTSPILKVVGTVTVKSKSSVPTHDKQVKENSTGKLGETADYTIGDDVPFVLHGTLPSNYADFDSYKYGFRDTLSKAFNDPQNVKVYVDDKEITEGFTVSKAEKASDTEGHYVGGKTFSVEFEDLKKAAPKANKDSKIRVEYTAKLNSNAAIDDKGNGNKSQVYYQKSTAEGTGKETPGETPWDNTWVFTYTIENTKTDASTGDRLAGAEFKLYREVQNDQGKTVKEYAKLDENNKVASWVTDAKKATAVKTVAGKTFKFQGLDAGKYYLEETKAPEGYVALQKPVEFTIEAKHEETKEDLGKLTSLTAKHGFKATQARIDGKATSRDLTTATVYQNIENTSSSDLPSTGGMGTVLFTAGGLAVMLLAGFGIVARNRKRAEA